MYYVFFQGKNHPQPVKFLCQGHEQKLFLMFFFDLRQCCTHFPTDKKHSLPKNVFFTFPPPEGPCSSTWGIQSEHRLGCDIPVDPWMISIPSCSCVAIFVTSVFCFSKFWWSFLQVVDGKRIKTVCTMLSMFWLMSQEHVKEKSSRMFQDSCVQECCRLRTLPLLR